MELTQTEQELTEAIKSKPDWWVLKYKRMHYYLARNELRGALHDVESRKDGHLEVARIHRGLARVASREIQRRRDDIERDHI